MSFPFSKSLRSYKILGFPSTLLLFILCVALSLCISPAVGPVIPSWTPITGLEEAPQCLRNFVNKMLFTQNPVFFFKKRRSPPANASLSTRYVAGLCKKGFLFICLIVRSQQDEQEPAQTPDHSTTTELNLSTRLGPVFQIKSYP